MEWGAEVERDYSGWLEVADGADGESQVTVHLNFGERSVEPEMREQTPEGRDPLAEGISATLESMRRQIEEGSGKVEPRCLPWRRAKDRREPGRGRRRPTRRSAKLSAAN